MIDNQSKTMALIKKMKTQLPIPVRPTNQFIRAMKDSKINIAREQELQVDKVFYMGDEGGITSDYAVCSSKKSQSTL